MALRVAKATDLLEASEHERLLVRMATPAAKFFNCSRAPSIATKALQCHGGNGFIEANPMARLYREAPLNSVWEGTANMMCMDVRRAMTATRAPSTRYSKSSSPWRARMRDSRRWRHTPNAWCARQ